MSGCTPWTESKKTSIMSSVACESPAMGKYKKLIERILSGRADADISFDELCQLLHRLGFEERSRGSHHIFRKVNVEEKINLQRDDGKAKPYQVRQIRSLLLKYKLLSLED